MACSREREHANKEHVVTQNEAVKDCTEHLKLHRQVILVRSALIGAAMAMPLPAVSDLLAKALSRGLVYHIARLRYVDIDDAAVEALLSPEEKKARLSWLSTIGSLASLLRKQGRMRRLFAGLAVLHGLEEASHAFHLATLLDHYCARFHTGAAIKVEEAKKLRATIDEATRTAQRAMGSAALELMLTQGIRLISAVPKWVVARVTTGDALPPLPALAALVHEARVCLGTLSTHRYLEQVIDSFDQKWGAGSGSVSQTP